MRDDARASAVRDRASGIRHIRAVAERRVGGDGLFRVFFRGYGLAGERRLLYLERRGGKQPDVRGDDVAGFQLDDVARYYLLAGEMFPLAVAQHFGESLVHVFQGFHCVFRLVLLHHAYDGVEDDDEQNDARVDEFGRLFLHDRDDRRHHGSHDEDDDHDVLELLEELDCEALFLSLFERVLAVLGGALLRLGGRESLFRGGQCLKNLVRGLVVVNGTGCGFRRLRRPFVLRGLLVKDSHTVSLFQPHEAVFDGFFIVRRFRGTRRPIRIPCARAHGAHAHTIYCSGRICAAGAPRRPFAERRPHRLGGVPSPSALTKKTFAVQKSCNPGGAAVPGTYAP